MVFGAVGDHVEATVDEHLGHRLGVLHHLLLVGLEGRVHGFLEADRLGGDDVLQRAALAAGEDGGVDLLLQVFVGLAQDQAAARAAQGLVGGGGGDVGDAHRAGVDAGGDQAGHVGHVHQQDGAHFVGDVTEALPVDDLGVGGEAGHDHLRLVLAGQLFHLVVVDQAGVVVQAVLDGVVHLAGEIRLGTVGQVTAGVQAHAEHGVAGLEHRHVDRRVGLGAGVGLDVGPVGAEQLAGAFDGQVLDHVHVFAAAVVALARVALGVLVGEYGALGFHGPGRGVVLGGDQLDVLLLALALGVDGGLDFRVELGDGHGFREHGLPVGRIAGSGARILTKKGPGWHLSCTHSGRSHAHGAGAARRRAGVMPFTYLTP